MAMTQLGLLFIGVLALLGTVALFLDYADRWTEVAVTFGAAIFWAVFGISAYDVRMPSVTEANLHTDEPMLPLVYLGIAMAAAVALYGFHDLIRGIGQQATSTDADFT